MPEVNEVEVEVPEAEEVEEVEVLPDGLTSTPMSFFPKIWDGSWKALEADERQAFCDRFCEFVQATNTLREKYDAVVWAGHVDGSVPESIKYIRAPRTGEAGGPKAKVKTAAELLLKK